MGGTHSPKLDSKASELKPDSQTSKRRKVVEKTVVTVKIAAANSGKLKNEGPPSDFWSWRKYGQKPIKGSPYPRGYYRCSTSKGCSAKKQVEKCRTDASMLIITYTSSHNHPGPDIHNTNHNQRPKEDHPTTPEQEQPQQQKQQQQQQQQQEEEEMQNQPFMTTSDEDANGGHIFHHLRSPIRCSHQDIIINQDHHFTEFSSAKTHHDTSRGGIFLDEEPISGNELLASPRPKSEEDDFFDELEELPTSAVLTSFMGGNLFDERIPVVPS